MDISAIALSGVQAAQTAFDASASRMLAAVSPASDTVELSTAAVELMASQSEFATSLQVMKVADQIDKRAIDLLG